MSNKLLIWIYIFAINIYIILVDGKDVYRRIVRDGQLLTFSCKIENDGNARWRWYLNKSPKNFRPFQDCFLTPTSPFCDSNKDGIKFYSNNTVSAMEFTKVGFENAGNYTCTDDNNLAEVVNDIMVVGKEFDKIKVNGEEVAKGDTVDISKGNLTIIECSLRVNHSMLPHFLPEILLNGDSSTKISENLTDKNTLTAVFDQPVRGNELLTCTVKPPEDFEKLFDSVQISVSIRSYFCPDRLVFHGNKSDTVVEGGRLFCEIEAYPPVGVQWFMVKDGKIKEVGFSEPNKAIVQIFLKDIGTYMCKSKSVTHPLLPPCSEIDGSIRINRVTKESTTTLKTSIQPSTTNEVKSGVLSIYIVVIGYLMLAVSDQSF